MLCTLRRSGRIYLERTFFKLNCLNPKGGELWLSKAKSEEIQMEA